MQLSQKYNKKLFYFIAQFLELMDFQLEFFAGIKLSKGNKQWNPLETIFETLEVKRKIKLRFYLARGLGFAISFKKKD